MIEVILFAGLNVLDAFITKLGLASGQFIEGNPSPIAQHFGSNMLWRGIVAAIIMAVVVHFDQRGWVKWGLLIGMLCVVIYTGSMYFFGMWAR
ncbi:MAG: DUF5658 family protein [Dehalococcoidales bacterium]|nr:DUF5658 family protein [Dehalococcoidales bacterium]